MNWICFLGIEIKRISPVFIGTPNPPVPKQQIQNRQVDMVAGVEVGEQQRFKQTAAQQCQCAAASRQKEWTMQPSDLNSRYENGMSVRLAEVNHVSENVMPRRPN